MNFTVLIYLFSWSLSYIWTKEDLKANLIDKSETTSIAIDDICLDAKIFMKENPRVLDRDPWKILENYEDEDEKFRNKEKFIGEGSFGKIFEVKFNGKPAAVKIFKRSLDDDIIENELYYWIFMYTHTEEDVPEFYDCVREDDYVYIYMELMDGPITNLIRDFRLKWNEKQRLSLLLDIEKLMVDLEDLKVTHHNIKPNNLFYKITDGKLKVKLGDFELSNQRTRHKVSGGTDGFLAPEVFDSGTANYKSDTFAVGMTFWNMYSDDIYGDPNITSFQKYFFSFRKKLRSFFVNNMRFKVQEDKNIGILNAANIGEVITSMTRYESYRRPIASAVVEALSRLISEQPNNLI